MSGFTLLETVVTLGIISLFTTLVLVGWSATRDQQAIILSEQTLQSFLSRAQQQAFHEERSEACLKLYDENDDNKKRCSDVGVAVRDTTLRLFADTAGNDSRYTEDDFLLEEQTFPSGVRVPTLEWQSVLFRGVPPRLSLFGPFGTRIGGDEVVSLPLLARSTPVTIEISSYGHVERQ